MKGQRHKWEWFYGARFSGGEMRRCRDCRGFWVTHVLRGEEKPREYWRTDTDTSWQFIKIECVPTPAAGRGRGRG